METYHNRLNTSAFLILVALMFTACKKNKSNNIIEEVFLPKTITVSNHINPTMNGTIELTYNTDRQISSIKRVSNASEFTLTYSYDAQKKHTKTTLNKKLPTGYSFQYDYNFEYTNAIPTKAIVISTDDSGSYTDETTITYVPQTNRFGLWSTNYLFTTELDLTSGTGSIYDGWGLAATYSTNNGVFTHLAKLPSTSFFLSKADFPDLLLMAKKELKTLTINGHPSEASAGEYNSISVQRDAQNRISRYIIKNDTKTYAQFDITYITVQ